MPPASKIDHYENFPVASMLLPKRLRAPIEAIYRFARSADDLADEGDATAAERIAALNDYLLQLDHISAGNTPTDPIFGPLALTIRAHHLPIQLFRDLVDAFQQDVVKPRYQTHAELLDYSRRSANPVGRLVLQLYGMAREPYLSQSDAICSALQFINFWQDVAVDWRKNRVYIPQEDFAQFTASEADIAASQPTLAFRELLRFQCERASGLMNFGAPLGRALPGRMGLELRLTIAGGVKILEKIHRLGYDTLTQRPKLTARDWPLLLIKSL